MTRAGMMRRGTLVLSFTLSTAVAASHALAQPAAWKPEKNVEIVAGAGAGGGFDTTARAMQRIWQEKGLIGVTSSVVNRPGAGGALGWLYLNSHPGDGHYLSVSSPVLLTNKILGQNPLTYTDITPVAQLFSEHITFMVRADSPLRTGRDLIERLKADPAALSIGIATALGNHNHMASGLALRAGGVSVRKLKTVVFNSGAEALTALLGGHVDLVPTPASNSVRHLEAGKVRGLAVSSPRRMTGALAGVPTWKEQGIDAVFASWRGVVGPRGMTPEQLRYWNGVLARMVATEEWKKDLERNYWLDSYANAGEAGRYLESQFNEFRGLLADLGLAK